MFTPDSQAAGQATNDEQAVEDSHLLKELENQKFSESQNKITSTSFNQLQHTSDKNGNVDDFNAVTAQFNKVFNQTQIDTQKAMSLEHEDVQKSQLVTPPQHSLDADKEQQIQEEEQIKEMQQVMATIKRNTELRNTLDETFIVLIKFIILIMLVFGSWRLTRKQGGNMKIRGIITYIKQRPNESLVKLGFSLIALACLFPPRLLIYANGYKVPVENKFQFLFDDSTPYGNIGILGVDYGFLSLEVFVLFLLLILAPYVIKRLNK